jgi:hypothetical protein
LLRVDPERRFLSPPSKAGLSAVERVKKEGSNMKSKAIWVLLTGAALVILFGGAPAKGSTKATELSFSNHLPSVHPYVKEVFEPWAAEIE